MTLRSLLLSLRSSPSLPLGSENRTGGRAWCAILLGLCLALALPTGAAFAQDEDEPGGTTGPVGPRRLEVPPADEPAAEPEAAAVEEPIAEPPPPEVRAADAPSFRVYVVAVPTTDGLDALAQRAGASARAALREIEGVDWQHADQLFLGYDDSALARIESARTRLAEGRQAYLNYELDQAAALLDAAIADFDAAAGALEDPQELADALVFLGSSLALNGRPRDAIRVFSRLHVQLPHVSPDPAVFPPEVIARFEAARPRDASDASASIVIESDPPGAIAYVDYVARGVTPLTVTGLRGGDHVVRVSRAGATPFYQTLTVRAHRSAETSAFLVDDPRAVGLNESLFAARDADVSALGDSGPLRDIANVLELDRIALIRASASENPDRVALELVVFDVATGRRLARGAGEAPTAVGELEPAVTRLVAGSLEAAARVRATDEAPPPVDEELPIHRDPVPPPSTGTNVVEEWWFWTIIGVVAVGAGVGIGVGVASTSGGGLGQDPDGHVILEF